MHGNMMVVHALYRLYTYTLYLIYSYNACMHIAHAYNYMD